MVDVFTFKAANDLNDRIDFPDVAQKLVAQSLALAGTGDEPCDIHKLDGGREDFFGFRKFGQLLQAVVRHIHDANIRLDRAEGEIGSLGLAGAGDGVEES